MARLHLGGKRVSAEAVERWKAERGYDQPLFVNSQAGGVGALTETIFFQKSGTPVRRRFRPRRGRARHRRRDRRSPRVSEFYVCALFRYRLCSGHDITGKCVVITRGEGQFRKFFIDVIYI